MMEIAAAIAALPAAESEWDSLFTAGAHPPGAVTLVALASDPALMDAALADAVANATRPDARMSCAYLVGTLSWQVGNALAGLWLSGVTPAAIDPAAVAVSTRWIDWDDAGTLRRYAVLDVNIDPTGLTPMDQPPVELTPSDKAPSDMTPGAGGAGDLARIMVDLHAGLIAALAVRTGLGVAAQWRLVGDGLSSALLERGKAMGCLPRAMQAGQTILRTKGRLYSPQTDYVQVTVPADAPPDLARASDWYRLRGGCCRYYTDEGGEYCTTCVLRDRDDQISRLRDYLETTLAA